LLLLLLLLLQVGCGVEVSRQAGQHAHPGHRLERRAIRSGECKAFDIRHLLPSMIALAFVPDLGRCVGLQLPCIVRCALQLTL
jgi:hypothetical protein